MSGGARARIKGLVRRGVGLLRGETAVGAPVAPVASVQFGDGEPLVVEVGSSILRAAIERDVDLDHFCGGNRSCGTCRVEIVTGLEHLSPRLPGESLVLGPRHEDTRFRLGCQARVFGPVRIRIPSWF